MALKILALTVTDAQGNFDNPSRVVIEEPENKRKHFKNSIDNLSEGLLGHYVVDLPSICEQKS